MDGNYYPYPTSGGFTYDQSLDFITEDFVIPEQHSHNPLAVSLLGPTELPRPQDLTQVRKPPRPQRQKSTTSEQTKHRRTRSGCYTCRQRRVKCDESRPICERCRKGKRDCTYPDKTTSSKGRSAPKSKSPSADNTSSSSDELEHDEQASSVLTDDIEAISVGSTRPIDFETSSITSRPSRADSKRSTVTIPEDFDYETQAPPPRRPSGVVLEHLPEWKTWPEDIKFYVDYFQANITYCHYAFKHDCRDFLKTSYLDAAINFKPLFYAVVAFSAYHYALRHTDSRPEKFLDYYDQSVTLFRQNLVKGNAPTIPVLLTMLQLATIEEFLGDWVNLLNHQRAAAQLIKETYTVDDITEHFTYRVILVWYWRFDLFAGVLSGKPLTLDRKWFAACVDSCAKAAKDTTPDNLGVYFDHFFTNSRFLITDVTLLFAAHAAGKMTEEEFEHAAVRLWERLEAHAERVENIYRDPAFFNKSWHKTPDENDLTEYTDPNFMYTGLHFTMNYILVDSWSGRLVFAYRLQRLRNKGLYTRTLPQLAPDLVHTFILKMCKMLEAIQYSDGSPAGSVLGLQASLGIVSLFIPHDSKYTDWARRKLALIETNGYIYPPSYRKWMAEIWSLDIGYWWFPGGQGLTPMIQSMRHFIDFRAQSVHKPVDDRDVEVRDMRGIFSDLNLAIAPLKALNTAE